MAACKRSALFLSLEGIQMHFLPLFLAHSYTRPVFWRILANVSRVRKRWVLEKIGSRILPDFPKNLNNNQKNF